MSFRFERRNILTGSLNLLPPGDLLPAEDAVSLQNWRVDQAGALRSRLQESFVANVGGTVRSIYTANSAQRYYGSSGNWYRGAALLEGGFANAPIYMSYFQGFVWAMNASKQRREEFAGLGGSETWLPTAPAGACGAAAGAGTGLSGTYRWYFTYATDTEETNPTEASADVTLADQDADITLVASADARVNGIYVYREGGTLPGPVRVSAKLANANGTHTDSLSDEEAARTGIALEIDHDPPPAGRGLVGPYLGRLLAWKGNTLYWSALNRPAYWPGAAAADGNHEPVGADGDEILNVTLHARHARIYKQRSIWRLSGDPDDLDALLEPTNAEMGLAGELAVCSVGAVDYFLSTDGIYVFNGDVAVKISGKLDPLFKEDPVYTEGALAPAVSPDYRQNACLAHRNGKLYFAYTPAGGTANTETLVYDIASKRWSHEKRSAFGGWTVLYDEGTSGDLLGAAVGVVFALETANPLSTITLDYTSGYQDQGRRDRQKTYADVTIDHSVGTGGGIALTAKGYFDDGQTQLALGTINVREPAPAFDRTRTTFRINGGDGQMAKNLAVHIDGDVTNQDVVVYGIEYHFRFEPRDALTFDSGVIDLGYAGAKEIDLLELDIASSGVVTWTLYTDIPGPALASAATGTVAATTTQQLQTIVTGAKEARLCRLLLTSPSPFRLYGARLRKLEIPLRFDGANGESYESPPLPA